MKNGWSFDRCVQVLAGEIELLQKIFTAQDSMRRVVMSREWADFDGKNAELERMGAEFVDFEKERQQLFAAIGASEDGEEKPFYELVSRLPLEHSRELSRLYRELKLESYKLKAQNEIFLAYLNEARTVAAAYLEAVCPARSGKLYTRKGSRVSQDLRSMVINNSL